jgi:hypothetical protein
MLIFLFPLSAHMRRERRILRAHRTNPCQEHAPARLPAFRFSKAMMDALDESADAIAALPD